VVFARGTFEAAPIGARIGPPFEAALKPLLASEKKTLSFLSVNYPADMVGFVEGGSLQGSRAMAKQLSDAAMLCPNASLVSAGYSQGAQLVHNSAKMLSFNVTAHIKAVVTFGNPGNGQAIGGIPPPEIDIICHPVDVVCLGEILLDIFLILDEEQHLWVEGVIYRPRYS
ncbi:cutinase, partial [Mycena polygramma]